MNKYDKYISNSKPIFLPKRAPQTSPAEGGGASFCARSRPKLKGINTIK